MANNRLYIVDRSTGEWVCIAKSMAGGWYALGDVLERLDKFFERKDPQTEKPLDWLCSVGTGLIGFPGKTTDLALVDESQFDPSGWAKEARRVTAEVGNAIKKAREH
jgi:hypothetical protein